ncbi:MAG: FkbM family methyltransferase [Nitrospira sp.]|nr:FkbM family methyltransferase [Nitrospira sp.]
MTQPKGQTALQPVLEKLLGGQRLIIADAGAAYGLPAHLQMLTPVSLLCLFEPHAQRAEELRQLLGAEARVFQTALSCQGGERTLYVTNVPTGTSLLRPGSDAALGLTEQAYFFPVQEQRIHTRRLEDVLGEGGIARLDFLKADVQGAELEILQGLGAPLSRTLLGVELEVGFPGGYIGQPGFGDVDQYLRALGLELLDLRLARIHRFVSGSYRHLSENVFGVHADSTSLSKRLWEADALYFVKPATLLHSGDVPAIRRLAVLYCAYGFYTEAYHLLDQAGQAGMLPSEEVTPLKDDVVRLHRVARFCVFESMTWYQLTSPFRRLGVRLRNKLCGFQVGKWQE